MRGRLSFGQPKTAASRRTLALPSFLVEELQTHMDRFATHGELVFAGRDGGPLRRTNFRSRVWLPAVESAGLAPLRFHDLRHTAAGLLIAQGAHPKLIQSRLGHSSIQVTFDVYGHLLPALDEELAKGLDAARAEIVEEMLELGELKVPAEDLVLSYKHGVQPATRLARMRGKPLSSPGQGEAKGPKRSGTAAGAPSSPNPGRETRRLQATSNGSGVSGQKRGSSPDSLAPSVAYVEIDWPNDHCTNGPRGGPMISSDDTFPRRVSQTLRAWELVLMSALIVVALSDAVDFAFTNTTRGATGSVREIDWHLSEHGPQRHIAAMIDERRRSLEEMKRWLTKPHAARMNIAIWRTP